MLLLMNTYEFHCFTFIFFSWIGLVSKNYEIERACLSLEAEVELLKREKETRQKWKRNFLFEILNEVNRAKSLNYTEERILNGPDIFKSF